MFSMPLSAWETGQVSLASWARRWKSASSIPSIFAVTVSSMPVIPPSPTLKETAAEVSTEVGGRSEERRVGKECGCGRSREQENQRKGGGRRDDEGET